MFLKEIRISSDNNAREPNFLTTVHHIREIFMELIPYGFVLDGSSILQINCFPAKNEPIYSRDSFFGCSVYFFEDFDLNAYYLLSKEDREKKIFQIVSSVMINIMTEIGGDAKLLREIIQAVEKSGFYPTFRTKKGN
jgi:hypothetical protein